MDILTALATLDPDNDKQWTGDGLPVIAFVRKLVGGRVNRRLITDAAPDFNRQAAIDAQTVDPSLEILPGDEGSTIEETAAEPEGEAPEPSEAEHATGEDDETEDQRRDRLTAEKDLVYARREEVRQYIVDANSFGLIVRSFRRGRCVWIFYSDNNRTIAR